MRRFLIAGIILFGLGAFVLLWGASFTSRRQVLEVGDVQFSSGQRQSIPTWVGGVVLVAGVALVLVGTRRRRHTLLDRHPSPKPDQVRPRVIPSS